MLRRALVISVVVLLASVATVVIAQPDDNQSLVENTLKSLSELEFDDDRAVAEAIGKLHLECAALFQAMSNALADPRPATAQLFREYKNFHHIVGQFLITEPDETLGSSASYAGAYIEAYMLDTLPSLSSDDLEYKSGQCSSDAMQEQGKQIIEYMESQLSLSE